MNSCLIAMSLLNFSPMMSKYILFNAIVDINTLQEGFDKLESVHWGCIKRFNVIGHLLYTKRLDRLNAETLELRRLKSDLTMVFCIIRGFVDIDCDSFLLSLTACETSYTGGHNLRLFKNYCNLICRFSAFVCRNINVWKISFASLCCT